MRSYCFLKSGVDLEKFPVLAPPSCAHLGYASNLEIEIWIGREEPCVCARASVCRGMAVRAGVAGLNILKDGCSSA